MAEPSEALVRQAQQGEERALVALVSSQERYVYSLALSILGNPDDAADLVQEVVVRLLRSLPTYRGETKFSTWLYRLTVNLAIDFLRKRSRQAAISLDDDSPDGYHEPEDVDPLVDPLLHLDRQETERLVRGALRELPPLQRAALTMYYFDELQYEEIAAALGLPLNTLKSHIRRAKLRLARVLAASQSTMAAVEEGARG